MATANTDTSRLPLWVTGAIPVVIIAALVALFFAFNPIATLREVPPVEALSFERTILRDGMIELQVRNDGPDSVVISQVLVNDSYRSFTATDARLGRLEGATIRIPYPWEDGLPVVIGLVTSTGLVLEHEIEVAALTPEADAATLGTLALLGLYIGVIPVAIGLLWFPSLRQASRKWLLFFLAFTVGLLVFLLVDTVSEGLELAGETGAALDGLGLFSMGVLVAIGGLVFLESALGRRRDAGAARRVAPLGGLSLAYLIAAGIGLHNMGEGLAVGAALATGEVALGTFLIVGFALHNTTEGLAIVAPLGREERRPSLWHFVALGSLAGAPAIVGAWLGGFAFSAAYAALAFGLAAGAIAQVVWQIGRGLFDDEGGIRGLTAMGLLAGFAFMYLTGLLVTA
ncbi:MAG: ZIP family metal transporter [Actinomycetota bacterium]